MSKAEKVLKRFRQAKKRKVNWAELYEEAQSYVAPHRENFDDENDIAPGLDKTGRGLVFDATAINGVQKFASNLQSSLVPPMRRWIDLRPGLNTKDIPKIEETLADVTEVFFSALHNSNFDIQISECFQDLAIGTGALLAMKGTKQNPFRFISVPLSQLWLLEGSYGRPDTAYREWSVPLKAVKEMWDDAKLPKELEDQYKEDPQKKVKLVEEIYPAEITVTNPDGKRQKIQGFEYTVIACKGKHVLVEREQRSSPWIIFRWSASPDEIYGRGPVLHALADIKTLNKTKELLLKAASINLYGMWLGDPDTINLKGIKMGPATIIPAEGLSNGRGTPMQQLQSGADVNLAQLIISDLQNTINNMLFADPLGPIDLPVKSATEVSLRQQELAKRIGSSYGRLQYELIQPLVNRCLDILEELELIDIAQLRVDGQNLDIQHESPLARAQSEEEVQSIMRWMEMLAGLYGPESLQLAAPLDKVIKTVPKRLNIPQEMVPSDEEIEATKAQITQAAQQQMEPPVG